LLKDYTILDLEDKVFVEEKRDVMAKDEVAEDHDEVQMRSPITRSKPKKHSTKLKYFDDYDYTC